MVKLSRSAVLITLNLFDHIVLLYESVMPGITCLILEVAHRTNHSPKKRLSISAIDDVTQLGFRRDSHSANLTSIAVINPWTGTNVCSFQEVRRPLTGKSLNVSNRIPRRDPLRTAAKLA